MGSLVTNNKFGLASSTNRHKNVFLNGELEVYIAMSLRFYKEGENVVCKLKKSLYDIKQPGVWFDRFAKIIWKQVYQQRQPDHNYVFLGILGMGEKQFW